MVLWRRMWRVLEWVSRLMAKNYVLPHIVYASPWIDEDYHVSSTHRIIAHVPEFDTIRCDIYGTPSEASVACYATHIQLIDGRLTAGQYDLTKRQALFSAARRYRAMK